MKAEVITDPEFIAAIQAKSVRAPHRDTPGCECWQEGRTDHYFIGGAYWRSDYWLPTE